MMPMNVAEVAKAVRGRLIMPAGIDGTNAVEDAARGESAICSSVVTDSRQASRGTVFVAIKGERVDGHDFVAGVAAAGAAAAIVDHEVDGALPQIVVPDTVEALGLLAQRNIELRRASAAPFTLIGLTGSVGKTTTKDLLASLLGALGPVVAPVGSFNNEIGLPLTALGVGEDTRFFVAEMGANHVGEISHLTTIAPPDVAIVLKVGVAHLGEFGSVERIAQAKSEIVRGLVPGGRAVLSRDDPHVIAMAGLATGPVSTFGLGDWTQSGSFATCGDMTAEDIELDGHDRASFTLRCDDGQTARVRLAIPGAHTVMNAMAAATVAHMEGLPLVDIARLLGEQRSISPHRMAVSTVEREGSRFTLIDDSFNANPDSMRAGLDALARWEEQDGDARRGNTFRVAVLGAMLELGGDEEGLHESIGSYVASLGLDALVAVGNPDDAHFDTLAGAIAKGARSALDDAGDSSMSVDWVHDADQADARVRELTCGRGGSVVLLKGSHASGLSALAERWTPRRAA